MLANKTQADVTTEVSDMFGSISTKHLRKLESGEILPTVAEGVIFYRYYANCLQHITSEPIVLFHTDIYRSKGYKLRIPYNLFKEIDIDG